jgi:subtilase family serine protease
LALSIKQQAVVTPPDLVALTTPASVPPEGFCRRNAQGQLLVQVYNQGGSEAAASQTRVSFAGVTPADVATPVLAAGASTELAVNVPNQCFDANNQCRFTLGVDAAGGVSEANETNNNAPGLCGPQFQ